MKNKLDKEYFLKLYKTYEEDNMVYALTILKGLGLKDFFLKNNGINGYSPKEINALINNIKFLDMYDLDEFVGYHICAFISRIDNGISYFNERQLNKLDKYQIKYIIKCKPESDKHLINCKNYGK